MLNLRASGFSYLSGTLECLTRETTRTMHEVLLTKIQYQRHVR